MAEERTEAFRSAQNLFNKDQVNDALEAIAPYTSDKETELTPTEMTTFAMILSEKITGAAFEEKKDVCNEAIDRLEGVKLVKDTTWISAYGDVLYETFSKMNRCARDEERDNAWCRLKEVYIEVLMVAKKVWKEKNDPERLQLYLMLSKLCKSYLDVADEETIKMCEDAAKEAKFVGKGTLEDDEWKDANKAIEDIKKNCSAALHEKELLKDSD